MKKLKSYLGIVIGAFIFAFGLNYFIIANGLAEGGFTGVSLIIHYITNWPVGLILLVINIPLIILGWWKWGKVFLFKTIIGVVMVSVAVDLTKGLSLHTNDLLLASLYGGVLSGIGIGIVLRSGATTGGVDIIARYFFEEKGFGIGKTYFIFDLLLLGSVAFLFGLEVALYTLVTVFVFSLVVDRVIDGFDKAKAVIIISSESQAIVQAITKELDRGITIIKGLGGYTKAEKEVLYVVVGWYQVISLKKIIRQIDPRAFVIVNDVHEVLGEGFKSSSELGETNTK
ncbi:MAG: YitT family protein [Peptococcia bacterium]